MSMSFRTLIASGLACAAVLCSAGAGAAGNAKNGPAPAASAAAKTPLLTRDQLRDCMARQDAIQAHADQALQAKEALQRDKAEITRRGDALSERLATLDRTSQEAVDSYNAQAKERDALIEAYDAAVTQYNARVDALQSERDTRAAACANRRYDEKDEAAIRSGR